MERAPRGHTRDLSADEPLEHPVTITRTRRWRLAAAGVAIAATSFTTAACGSDTVDDGVEQEVEDAGNEVQEEVEGGDQDGDG
jgi:predicted small secreted protein